MQTESPVRHTKCGRMRGMGVGEGGRSTGFYCTVYIYNIIMNIIIKKNVGSKRLHK